MNRELRELNQKLADAEQRARLAIGDGKTEDAERAMEEVRDLKKRIAMAEELDKQERESDTPKGEQRDRNDLESEYRRVVLKAIRRRNLNSDDLSVIRAYEKEMRDVMHEGGATGHDDGDSSLVVPVDVQTKINELRRQLNDLTVYITNEQVNTLSGSRVLEKDADMTPFSVVAEYGEIGETDNPQFTPIEYKLVKRAGILPLTNELLADNDANLLAYVTQWLAKKTVVTYNGLMLATLDTLTKTAFASLDDIKEALNVTLDPAVSNNAVILTNQDGYHWLDTQKDDNGRYLLVDDITQPGRKLFRGRPVAVASNRHLKTVANKVPFIVGDLKETAVLFSRGRYELASTKIGGDAWRRDTTELRVITRDDCVKWDSAATVYGQIDITPAA